MRRWLGLTILAIILYPAAESRGSQIRAQCVIGLNLSDEFAVRKSGNKSRKTLKRGPPNALPNHLFSGQKPVYVVNILYSSNAIEPLLRSGLSISNFQPTSFNSIRMRLSNEAPEN
jgi:hypothetical protein